MHVTFCGRLTKDAESFSTANGKPGIKFQVADNSDKENPLYATAYKWGEASSKLLACLKKGRLLYITGKIRKPRAYTTKDGNPAANLDVDITTMEFLGGGHSEQNKEPVQPELISQPEDDTVPF